MTPLFQNIMMKRKVIYKAFLCEGCAHKLQKFFISNRSKRRMNPVQFIPIIIVTISLAYASFLRNKNWALISFVVWLVLFVLTFFIFNN